MAIVAGDYLLARSAAIAAGLGTEIAGLLATTLGRLCQGQVAEVRSSFQMARTTEQYFEAIAGKTAALMATSCRIGALTGRAAATRSFTTGPGRLGMLFQLRDQLDVVATDGELASRPARTWPRGSTRCRARAG